MVDSFSWRQVCGRLSPKQGGGVMTTIKQALGQCSKPVVGPDPNLAAFDAERTGMGRMFTARNAEWRQQIAQSVYDWALTQQSALKALVKTRRSNDIVASLVGLIMRPLPMPVRLPAQPVIRRLVASAVNLWLNQSGVASLSTCAIQQRMIDLAVETYDRGVATILNKASGATNRAMRRLDQGMGVDMGPVVDMGAVPLASPVSTPTINAVSASVALQALGESIESGSRSPRSRSPRSRSPRSRSPRSRSPAKMTKEQKKAAKEQKKLAAKADKDKNAPSKTMEKAAKDQKKSADKATKDQKKSADKATKDQKKSADKATKDQKKSADKSSSDQKKAAEKAEKDRKKKADKAKGPAKK